jgi:LmbE family N-acetylglucosaminyl deacetylase
MRYWFLGAHVDDVELSCGGTIARLIHEGHDIVVVSLSYMYEENDLLHEWKDSMQKLGVKIIAYKDFRTRLFHERRQDILDYLFTLKGFDFIFTHSKNDPHSDHATVGREAERAFKHTNLITFTGAWNHPEKPDYFVSINHGQVQKKIEALSCYKSQQHRPYMHSDFIWSNAMNNGVMCGTKYAEAFKVVNLIQ